MRLGVLGTAAAVIGALLATSACSSSGATTTKTSNVGKGQHIVVGAYAFPEGQLLANVYADALNQAGFKATVTQTESRETGEPALSKGSLDVIPEYTSSLLDYFKANSSTADDAANLKKLQQQAQAHGVKMLNPAPATDNYAFGVLTSFAKAHNLTTLSDLANYSKQHPVTVAGIQECVDRSYCLAGLKKIYGLKVANFKVTVLASQASVDLLKNNQVQLVQFDSSDGVLADNPVTILKDDKGLNHADYVIPAVNAKAWSPGLAKTIDAVQAKLTQDKLNAANKAVQVDRTPVTDEANTLLQSLTSS